MVDDETPIAGMRRAVADLWSQSIREAEDFVVFYDHFGNPARIRLDRGKYLIAWAVGGGEEWDEDPHEFANPREAALYAFQGPEKGRFPSG